MAIRIQFYCNSIKRPDLLKPYWELSDEDGNFMILSQNATNMVAKFWFGYEKEPDREIDKDNPNMIVSKPNDDREIGLVDALGLIAGRVKVEL